MNKNTKSNSEKHLETVIDNAVKKLAELSNVNMIIGAPIVTSSGTTIIPVSKISVGFLSGGGEYGDVSIFKPNLNYPHTGGSGGVLSVKASGFIIEKKGVVKFIHCPNDAIEKLVDSCDEWINNKNGKNSNIKDN